MAKLYPPQINGTIPAFYANTTKGTTEIVVPFSMNRAVSFVEIEEFILQIKTLNGSLIGTVPSKNFNKENLTVTFNVRQYATRFTIGSYYKLQLAYKEKNTNEIGYYSTVGVIKYTTYPTVFIDKLSTSKTNPHQYDYAGVYSQKDGDATEKLYSSKFIIYDNNDVFYESEEILHNNTNDTERYMAVENFKFLKSLTENKVYQVEFIATTANGLVAKSPRYRIVQRKSVDPSIHADLKATLNFNNGYILLTFENCQEPIVSGSFLVSRCSNLNNYTWEPIREFSLQSVRSDKWTYKDCTIEQGVLYKYSIQQFNSNQVYSSRIESNLIEVDFEDAFLFDGERQLRIRFNPKISSFKTDLQEQKTDTIGHQYPYFTRNSHIYYKEFPISGLISYLSDENELFIKKSELKINYNEWDSADDRQSWQGVPKDRASNFYEITTQLTANNFISERTFKMTVLAWLNNGKPKLFRSPGEGNYLVRLMNASLSPTDSLSRMLHTFSCTAYEINNCNLETLASYKIYDQSLGNETQRHWISINIADYVDNFYQQMAYNKNSIYTKAYWRELKETNPNAFYNLINGLKEEYMESNGDQYLNILNGIELQEIFVVDFMPGSSIKINDEEIVIGTTGSYRVVNELDPFTSFSIDLNSINSGIITYSYEEQTSDVFGTMEEVVVYDVPCYQAIGHSQYKNLPVYDEDGQVAGVEVTYDLLQILQDSKKSILDIAQLKAIKRPIIDVILNELPRSTDNEYRNIVSKLEEYRINDLSFTYLGETYNLSDNDLSNLNPNVLYQLRAPNTTKNVTLEYFLPDEQLDPEGRKITYIYSQHQPFTFEQYYIDKQNKQKNDPIFNPYTGFFFSPLHNKIIKATKNNLFTFQINDEIIDVSDIESWQVKDLSLNDITQIIPGEGVILELSYPQQSTTYQFDSLYENSLQDEQVVNKRKEYENLFAFYLVYRNQGYDQDTLNVIKDYCPSKYNDLVKNGELTDIYHYIEGTVDGIGYRIDMPIVLSDTSKVYEERRDVYVNTINDLETKLHLLYKEYIELLDKVIEQYRKDNGT